MQITVKLDIIGTRQQPPLSSSLWVLIARDLGRSEVGSEGKHDEWREETARIKNRYLVLYILH